MPSTGYANYAGGRFLPAGERWLEVPDPARGTAWTRVPLADADQVREATASAAQAQRAWARRPGVERGRLLHRLADALLAAAPEIGRVLARESGKSLADAEAEVRYAAELTHYHAEWGRRLEGELLPSDNPDETLWLQRAPIGVVACLIPFNYPVYTLLRKLAPALIAGNAVVARPSNHTPCSALQIARVLDGVGLPAGLVNLLVMDHDAAAVLCRDPAVGMMSLTGSVAAGRVLMQHAQAQIAKLSLELGGKTPVVVLADADLDAAADGIVASKTTHCGQVCTAAERVYVQREVYAAMVSRLGERFRARRWGDRAEDPTRMGPLVSAAARQRVHAMVQRAVADGARLVAGGELPDGPGYFYPPTLLVDGRQELEIVREETFGPVLVVLPCDDAEHALALANDHQYGLSAVLWTHELGTAMRFASQIESGELYVNRMPADPYQGYHAGWKRSGLGGDDGKHGMLEFTQTRLVAIAHPARPAPKEH